MRRLIRIEVGRTKEPQLYDLDFDVQLNAALEILREGNFKKLVKSTKTLKELQEEAEAADALSEKNSSQAQNEN